MTRRRLRRARRAAEVGAPRCASRSLSTRRQADLRPGVLQPPARPGERALLPTGARGPHRPPILTSPKRQIMDYSCLSRCGRHQAPAAAPERDRERPGGRAWVGTASWRSVNTSFGWRSAEPDRSTGERAGILPAMTWFGSEVGTSGSRSGTATGITSASPSAGIESMAITARRDHVGRVVARAGVALDSRAQG